jgi:uncharacterized protein YbbC (DUF1343 family)
MCACTYMAASDLSPKSTVLTGLDRVLDRPERLARSRVGLVTNASAVTRVLVPAVDALRAICSLTSLFSPEHGLTAHAPDGAPVATTLDARTNLPVYSLYGETKRPNAERLRDVDLLVFDIQDIGTRFYTYVWTMSYVLEAAAQCGVPMIVLDRPNPITGAVCEGPLLQPGFRSFVGRHPIPVRHGLTVGEIARLLNARLDRAADLTVVEIKGWRRDAWFDETGLPWVPPSPAMPKLDTAIVYPGTCLLEGTNVSEGRGTATPFECLGAPWIDGYALTDALHECALTGVRFRPASFSPSTSKYAGQVCHGVYLHVTDRSRFRPLATGLHVLSSLIQLWPEDFEWLGTSWEGCRPHFDLLIGNNWVRPALDRGAQVKEITARWQDELAQFRTQRQSYLLYD